MFKSFEVIQHLSNRRRQGVPINDGRKITLVLTGGVMHGVFGAGAMIALEELGLANAFDEIYSFSAGFANASYLLGQRTALGTSIYYDDLPKGGFINFWRFWKATDTDYLVEVMRSKKVLPVEVILEAKTKLYVQLLNSAIKQPEFLEVHQFASDNYLDLMQAATSYKLLNPWLKKFNGQALSDPGDNNNYLRSFFQQAFDSSATDLLVFLNNPRKEDVFNKMTKPSDKNIMVVSPRKNWMISRFETKPAKLQQAAIRFGGLIKELFGENTPINLSYK